MSDILDLSDDYLQWSFTEPVQYQSANRAGGTLDAIPVAKRRPLTLRELAASGGAYRSDDVKWIVPAAVLTPGAAPKPADVVIDADAARWTVLEVLHQRARQTYHLICRNPVIAFDLRDLIDVEQAAVSYDAAGAIVRTWPSGVPPGGTVLYAALACRVQPMTAEVKEERGIRGQEVVYEVHLSQQATIDVRECRVVWQGKTLDLVEYKDGNRIDVLPCLTARLKP